MELMISNIHKILNSGIMEIIIKQKKTIEFIRRRFKANN